MQRLPNIRSIDLPVFKCPPDLSGFQDKYPVRGQRNTFQDVGRKQDGSMFLIFQNLPIQAFRTLKIQAVDRLIQEKQPGFQSKSRNQKCFFSVSG